MKCPHCGVAVNDCFAKGSFLQVQQGDSHKYNLIVEAMACPACLEPILKLSKSHHEGQWDDLGVVYPAKSYRPLAALEVPHDLASDFNEAGKVLADSPKASAALSRRCLQGLLRAQGFKRGDLVKEIQSAIDSGKLPPELSEELNAVRVIGNFAAHPTKDTNSGEILEVEDHEAEWNLDVLEQLFDFFYVQPARNAMRKAALNEKLAKAGKPSL